MWWGTRNTGHWLGHGPICQSLPLYAIPLLLTFLTFLPSTRESPVEAPCANQNLDKCTCERVYSPLNEYTKVNCTNAGFTDVSPLHSIPHTVRSIVFSGNNIPVLNPNIMGKGANSACRKMLQLTALDLSRNNIRTIHGKAFHCMPQLEVLLMDNNVWRVEDPTYTRTFSSLPRLKTLSLKNALAPGYNRTHLKNVFIESFLDENNLEEIHLEDNHLKYYHSDLFCGLRNIQRIYLSRNNIATPQINPECIRQNNAPLKELHLDNNNITFFPTAFMESLSQISTLQIVNLSNNPFHCDCNFIASYRWLKNEKESHFVASKHIFTCRSPMDYENVLIMDSITEENLRDICINKTDKKRSEHAKKVRTSYIILGIVFGVLGIIFIAVLYLNRYKIQRKLQLHIVDPIRESIVGRNMHYGYASVSV